MFINIEIRYAIFFSFLDRINTTTALYLYNGTLPGEFTGCCLQFWNQHYHLMTCFNWL